MQLGIYPWHSLVWSLRGAGGPANSPTTSLSCRVPGGSSSKNFVFLSPSAHSSRGQCHHCNRHHVPERIPPRAPAAHGGSSLQKSYDVKIYLAGSLSSPAARCRRSRQFLSSSAGRQKLPDRRPLKPRASGTLELVARGACSADRAFFRHKQGRDIILFALLLPYLLSCPLPLRMLGF